MDEGRDCPGVDLSRGDCGEDAVGEVGRGGRGFRGPDPIGVLVEDNDVGEGAADIDGDPQLTAHDSASKLTP
jgi:hypothetical protein